MWSQIWLFLNSTNITILNARFCLFLTIHRYAIWLIDHPSHDYPSHIRSCNRFFPPGNGLGNMPRPFSQQPTPTLFHSQNHILAAFHFICKIRYSSLAHSCGQISCLHENLPAWMCEGSAISMSIASCRRKKELRSSGERWKRDFANGACEL